MGSRFRATGAIVFLSTLAFLAPLVHRRVFGAGNDASRFAQIEALVDQDRTSIEASRYGWTVDRVTIDGHDYSNKPPLLALAGALVYAAIARITGLGFGANEAAVVYLLNLLLVAAPTAWLVARFHCTLRRRWGGAAGALAPDAPAPGASAGPIAASGDRTLALVTTALAAGTILTSFSTTLNNHTVTAALLFAACEAAWSGGAIAAGAFAALAFCVDTVPGLVFAPALGAMVHAARGRRGLGRYLGALAAGAVLFLAADLYVYGNPLPAKMIPGAVDFSSRMAPSVAGVLLPSSWSYPLSALFGWHGFFTVSPVLLFGAAGMARSLRADHPIPRRFTLLLAAACAVLIAGHVLLVGSYGGWSYGFRYLIPIVPVLLFYAPAVMGPLGRRVFVPILAVSILFALLGAYNPWPPVDEPGTGRNPVASVVTNPVGGNWAALLRQCVPGGALAESSARLFVAGDRSARDHYFRLFFASKGDVETMQRIPEGAGP